MAITITQNEEDISLASFEHWLDKSRPGDRIVYHIGRLAMDREDVQLVPGVGQYAHIFYEPYHSIGNAAWHAYERGLVELVQRKLRFNRGYEYVAIKRKRQNRGRR